MPYEPQQNKKMSRKSGHQTTLEEQGLASEPQEDLFKSKKDAPRRRGRPKGSKNKTKSYLEFEDTEDERQYRSNRKKRKQPLYEESEEEEESDLEESSSEDSPPPPPVMQPPKRGRGRPRKNPLPEVVTPKPIKARSRSATPTKKKKVSSSDSDERSIVSMPEVIIDTTSRREKKNSGSTSNTIKEVATEPPSKPTTTIRKEQAVAPSRGKSKSLRDFKENQNQIIKKIILNLSLKSLSQPFGGHSIDDE